MESVELWRPVFHFGWSHWKGPSENTRWAAAEGAAQDDDLMVMVSFNADDGVLAYQLNQTYQRSFIDDSTWSYRIDSWSVEYQHDVEKMFPIKSRSKPHRAPAPLKIFLLKMNVIFGVSEKFGEISANIGYRYTVIPYMKGWFNSSTPRLTMSNDVLMASLSPHHS